MNRPFGYASIGLSIALLCTANAEADDTQCVGALAGTFDNVIVPPGATCSLTNSRVSGNVKALENSRLLIRDSNVGGNVEGDKADIVQIFFSVVREYISIKEGGPAAPPAPAFNVCGFGMNFTPCEALIAGTTVEEGSVQIEKMVGDVLVDRLVAPGNLKVEENPITEILLIQNSTVDQNLQCFENQPPFAGQFNAAGSAEGQCAPSTGP